MGNVIYRASTFFFERVRLLQPLLPRTQEGRCPQANFRSEIFEQCSYEKTIQNVHNQTDPCTNSPQTGLFL